ncbi:hypothetical protein F7725_028338 [Dissostichus mawsoni]|uniref:NACHT and WD repeat domain containing 1 n=1 Tax=Dissostichus mawsoni TaxID=36200 RepID=A0A7J5XFQ7_DISMA|nr:hypothetical protein F7725_028338 [Dissostichus mawsoni]
MLQLFLKLEEKHGKELVGGALGYIALAREGCWKLNYVTSCLSMMTSSVRCTSTPTSIHHVNPAAPLLWARLRHDSRISWKSAGRGGSLPSPSNTERRGRSLRILAEYFLGRWSGKTEACGSPGSVAALSDRKVPPQPLWFAPGLANIRKLQECPITCCMLVCGRSCNKNAEWLYCKSRVCGVSSVIQDLDQCSKYMDCTETSLLRDTLLLIKASLDFLDGHMDMSLFYTELLARLCSLAKPFPSVIGRLVVTDAPEPILIPKCSFLQQPGGALQYTLTGLQGGVLCVDLNVEAELLVAGSDGGVVAVWSLSDHQLVHSLLGHTGAVLCVKVVDSAAHCLSVAADGSLRRWSLVNGQQLLCIQEAIPVKVWQLDGGEVLSSSNGDGSVVLGVLGESVVSMCNSGLVRISQPINGTQTVETRLENCQRSVTLSKSVNLPKRGKVFFVSKEGFLYQISLKGRHMAVKFPLVPSLLSVTEDEKILVAGSDRTLSLFNIDRDSVDRFLELQHDDSVLSACVSSDCRVLASGAADQLIRIWSVTTGALLDTLSGSDSPVTSVLLYHGFVLSASKAAASVRLWSLKYDPRHKPTATIPAGCAHVAVTEDADRVFYVRQQSQTTVLSWNNNTGGDSDPPPLDLPAGSLSECYAVSAEVCCLEVAQHKRLLLCGLTTGTVLIYPLSMPQETLCIPPPESLSRVLCIAVSSQEKHMAVAYEDSVCLFEITNRDSFPTVEGPLKRVPLSLLHAPLSSMALLSDRRLLYGTSCGEVKLHDFSSGSSSGLEPHRSRVTCVTAGHWGTHALVGSEDAVQRLWALSPLVLDHTMEYKGFFFEGVLSAAFSDSDQFVFTGSQDRTVKVWDVASGNLLYVQYVYSPVVRMVTFRNGFVALSQQGSVIREVFHCPELISPDYNPLRNVKAQYRVSSRAKQSQDGQQSSGSHLQEFNPAGLNLNLMSMLRTRPSSTCLLL